jgi:miniconductance mechanosensitive channel
MRPFHAAAGSDLPMSPAALLDFATQLPLTAGLALFATIVTVAIAVGAATEAWYRRQLPIATMTGRSLRHAMSEQHIQGAVVSLAAMMIGQALLSALPEQATDAARRAAKGVDLAIIVLGALTALRALTAVHRHRDGVPGGAGALTGVIQAAKLVVLCCAALLVAARASGRSPAFVLSGIGALAAVFALVFRDTIVSFTAGLRLLAEDEARPGDWIESVDGRINGVVREIALHNVKVDGLDGSTMFVPNTVLTATPLRNWRGLERHGGRRMRRVLHVDPRSVVTAPDAGDGATNLDAYRAHAADYLRAHPAINPTLPVALYVGDSQLQGLALELHASTRATDLHAHEAAKSEITAALLAAMARYSLRPASPGGK